MVGLSECRVTVVADAARCRIIPLGKVSCEHTVRQFGYRLHARHNLITVFLRSKAFPFRHPVTGICQPVRSHPETGRCLTGEFFAGFCQTHRIQMVEQGVGIRLLTHQVARPLIGSQIIVKAVESRLADAGLLGATAPVAHIVTATQRCKGTDMIGVHLATVARHGLRHPPDIAAPRAQEVVPEPHRRGQLSIVPGETAHIVAPGVPLWIIGMHDVAIVPEAVPLMLFDGLLIEADVLFQPFLHIIAFPRLRQRPHAEGPFLIKIRWCGQQLWGRDRLHGIGSHRSLAVIAVLWKDPQGTGAGDAVGCTHALLHILIAGNEVVGDRIVMAQVHRLSLRTPQPQRQLCFLAAGLGDLYRGGIGLPEVFQPDTDAAAHVAHKGIAWRTDTRKGAYPGTAGGSPFTDGEGIIRQLRQAETVPLRPVFKQVTVHWVEGFVGWNTLALHLLPLQVAAFSPYPEVTPSVERLHWLCPHTTIVCDEGDVAVIGLFAHRHAEAQAKGSNHVSLFISIIDKGMHEADLIAASVEIESDSERQPLLPTVYCLLAADDLMKAFHLHQSPHTALPLHTNVLDFRLIIAIGRRGHQTR